MLKLSLDPDFVTRMLPKLEWSALVKAAKELAIYLQKLTESMATDETFLKKLHHILLEVRLIEGALVCPESDRKFSL